MMLIDKRENEIRIEYITMYIKTQFNILRDSLETVNQLCLEVSREHKLSAKGFETLFEECWNRVKHKIESCIEDAEKERSSLYEELRVADLRLRPNFNRNLEYQLIVLCENNKISDDYYREVKDLYPGISKSQLIKDCVRDYCLELRTTIEKHEDRELGYNKELYLKELLALEQLCSNI